MENMSELRKKERGPGSEHWAAGRSTPPNEGVEQQTYDAMRNRLQAACTVSMGKWMTLLRYWLDIM